MRRGSECSGPSAPLVLALSMVHTKETIVNVSAITGHRSDIDQKEISAKRAYLPCIFISLPHSSMYGYPVEVGRGWLSHRSLKIGY